MQDIYCIGKEHEGKIYYVRYEIFTENRDFAERFPSLDSAKYHLALIQREDPDCKIYRHDTGEVVA